MIKRAVVAAIDLTEIEKNLRHIKNEGDHYFLCSRKLLTRSTAPRQGVFKTEPLGHIPAELSSDRFPDSEQRHLPDISQSAPAAEYCSAALTTDERHIEESLPNLLALADSAQHILASLRCE